MAIDAIRALQESGRRVPDDVSVIGFDNMDMAAHLAPAMTTIRVHKRALGSVAVKTLIARAGHPARAAGADHAARRVGHPRFRRSPRRLSERARRASPARGRRDRFSRSALTEVH
jgi:DNA-binding LacI/PurR family transcriptional regulator